MHADRNEHENNVNTQINVAKNKCKSDWKRAEKSKPEEISSIIIQPSKETRNVSQDEYSYLIRTEIKRELTFSISSVLHKLVWKTYIETIDTTVKAVRCENLIPHTLRNRLLSQIKHLQKNVKDYRFGTAMRRGTGRIHDLIDPSLNINWFNNDLNLKQRTEAKQIHMFYAQLGCQELSLDTINLPPKHCIDNSKISIVFDSPDTDGNEGSDDNDDSDDTDDSINDENVHVLQEEVNDKQPNKPFACWIPAIYNLKDYKFVSWINNLSHIKYGDSLYKTIAGIFKYMIPMFETIINYKLGSYKIDHELQLIVKMQDYLLNNGENYFGEFHKEGIEQENIIALGIYYFDVDTRITGGNLDIISKYQPSPGKDYGATLMRNKVENIKSGTCVVLSNIDNTYHKVSQMSNECANKDDDDDCTTLSRKILSFFLINPKCKIKSSRDILVNWDDIALCVVNVWFRKGNENNQLQTNWLPNELIQMIIDCVIGLGKNRYTLRDERMKLRTPLIQDSRMIVNYWI